MTSQQRNEETRAFLYKVKDKFQDEREKFVDFLKVMKDYKDQRINAACVIARMKQLLKGHRDLISGFNNFLPIENKIKMSWTDEIAEASKFLNKLKLKTRFQGDDRVYKLFVRMLRTRNTKIVNEIATLLQDHADLLDEFTQYITETSETTYTHFTSVQNTLLDGSSAITTEQQMHVDHKEERDRRKWENHNRDLSPEQKSSHMVEYFDAEPLCDANENFGMSLMSSTCCAKNDMKSSNCICEQCTPSYRIECPPTPTKMSIQLMEYGHDKPKVTALSMDPDKKSIIFLKRNIRKDACTHEFSIQARDGLQIINGLNSKIACNSSKVSYVLNTGDVLILTRSKRRTLHQNDSRQEQAKSSYICSSRVMRFRKMFSIV